jgi:tRNA (mo5U34)-methyltransferase
MIRSAGFEITGHPEDEVYICRHVATTAGAGSLDPARERRHD